MVNHELEVKVALVLSALLPVWEVEVREDEEDEGEGEGEIIATITEISSCFPPLNILPACLARTAKGISAVSIPVSGSKVLLRLLLGDRGNIEDEEEGAGEED
jgi:hypothetical protein